MIIGKEREYNVEFRVSMSATAPNHEAAKMIAYDKIFEYFGKYGFEYDGAVVNDPDGVCELFGDVGYNNIANLA